MKRFTNIRLSLCVAIFVAGAGAAQAQTLGANRNPVRTMPAVSASVSTVLQDWTYNDTGISELSTIISSRVQLRANLGLSINVSQATVDHDSLQRITGVTDIQLGLSYVAEFERSKLLATVNGNIPSGKRDLSKWAYDAAFPMGLSQYDFHVPYFGRGWGVAPGLAWVYTASESVAMGIGASYHVRGAFEPHRQLPAQYNWGNEMSLSWTGQWQATPSFGFSAQLIYTSYGDDKIEDIVVYKAGNRTVGLLSAHARLGKNDLFATFHFRSVGENRIRTLEALQPETIKYNTGLMGGSLRYRIRATSIFMADVEARATRYKDTFDVQDIGPSQLIRYDRIQPIPSMDIFSVGVFPTIMISPAVSIPLRFRYSLGDAEGLEAGVGFAMVL